MYQSYINIKKKKDWNENYFELVGRMQEYPKERVSVFCKSCVAVIVELPNKIVWMKFRINVMSRCSQATCNSYIYMYVYVYGVSERF